MHAADGDSGSGQEHDDQATTAELGLALLEAYRTVRDSYYGDPRLFHFLRPAFAASPRKIKADNENFRQSAS